jgi:RIO-like serine/threonine protein kinase
MTKKRYITVKDLDTDQTFIIDCNNPEGCFKVAQKFHRLGEHKYRQIRFRSTIPQKYLGYKWLDIRSVLEA